MNGWSFYGYNVVVNASSNAFMTILSVAAIIAATAYFHTISDSDILLSEEGERNI